jgi:hypothetical protein
MNGLDKQFLKNAHKNLDHCQNDCQNTINSVDPSVDLAEKMPNFFNKIMIVEDIYTDTKDLGAGHEHHSHMGM